MDLGKMLNEDGGAEGGATRQPSQPSVHASSRTSSTAAPQTPIQAGHPAHAFRDYGHSAQSPVSAMATAPAPSPRDYPLSAHPGFPPGPYASPTQYHAPPAPFHPRPAPPPLHTHGPAIDPRSPGSAMSGPSPSYRHTPTSSMSASSGGGYPFSMQTQPPPSPQQRQMHYIPERGYRENYPIQQPGVPIAPPVGIPTGHGSAPYMQGQQQMMQAPPVGTPGGGGNVQYFQHQRSQSLHSAAASSPTSVHGPHQPYGAPYGPQAMASPVATTHHPPHGYQRQSSQPPTPLGPPMTTTPRQPSIAQPNFPQPTSPYRQRATSASGRPPPPPPLQPLYQQASPHAPQPQPIARLSSSSASHGALETHGTPENSNGALDSTVTHSRPQSRQSHHSQQSHKSHGSHQSHQSHGSHQSHQSHQSHHSRGRSLSVSPKTRVSSLPGPPANSVESLLQTAAQPAAMEEQQKREATPAKRKLDDRDLDSTEKEGDGANRRPPPPQLNGHHPPPIAIKSEATASPNVPRRRIKHAEPPIWAQSLQGRQPTTSHNYTIKSKVHGGSGAVNGNAHHHEDSKAEHLSRHNSPEATRSVGGGLPPPRASEDHTTADNNPLPWEPSIGFVKPFDAITKEIADRMYFNVLANEQLKEIQSRGVQFEIEAKFGQLIDRDTNSRIEYPFVTGENILKDGARVAFKSSMTETQHRKLNEWLNAQTMAATPQNPQFQNSANPHVPIEYKHRYETDRFFELPASEFFGRLPLVMQQKLKPNNPVKVRVTYEQKTGAVIAKIVKTRVHDIHLYLPDMPLDCRISVNLEWPWDGEVDEILAAQVSNRERQPDRNKDRLSYKHGCYQVDLTQVSQNIAPVVGAPPRMEKQHELEVELDGNALVAQGERMLKGQGHKYAELIDGLVDNVRMLARRCPPQGG